MFAQEKNHSGKEFREHVEQGRGVNHYVLHRVFSYGQKSHSRVLKKSHSRVLKKGGFEKLEKNIFFDILSKTKLSEPKHQTQENKKQTQSNQP